MDIGEVIRKIIDTGLYRIILLFILIFLLRLFFKRKVRLHTDVDKLVQLSEDRQCSEYSIFHDAAKKWNFSEKKIDEDFKRYLLYGELPRYVRDYVEEQFGGQNHG
ncbi:MAG TPA: hypothetical protein ENK09_02885 [Nitrospirae bacterium]|nr:hypothetical protein [Nitrospirota bacterium]